MTSILVLTCLYCIALPGVYGTSKKVLDFLDYFNGDHDNAPETKTVGDDHDLMQVRFIPVDIECLRPDAALLVIEAMNGELRILNLAVVTDGIEDTVSLRIYNFTDYTIYNPATFNPKSLFNISCDDLQGHENCTASYTVVPKGRNGFVFGNYPYCRYTVNGKYLRFTGVYMCDSLLATAPMFTHHASPVEPYELRRTSPKYPVVNAPADYVPPCDS